MNKQGFISYWLETANQDFNTMLHLYDSKDYHWSLFMGHLVVEKLLKALYIKNVDANVPRIHDLLRLSEKAGIDTNDKQKDILDRITTFNISARYPDYKQSFYEKCTQSFALENIDRIKEVRTWLLSLIN
ncbi:MAG: HEPN domain-containing protein [Clostridia bacterium]